MKFKHIAAAAVALTLCITAHADDTKGFGWHRIGETDDAALFLAVNTLKPFPGYVGIMTLLVTSETTHYYATKVACEAHTVLFEEEVFLPKPGPGAHLDYVPMDDQTSHAVTGNGTGIYDTVWSWVCDPGKHSK